MTSTRSDIRTATAAINEGGTSSRSSAMNARRQQQASRQLDMFAELDSAERPKRAARAPGVFELDQIAQHTRLAMAVQCKQAYGHVVSIRAAHAWMPCGTQMLPEHGCAHRATSRCRPTILLAELRCEHKHAWPGWRQLPTVPRRPDSGTSVKQPSAVTGCNEHVNRLYPNRWLEGGGPIRTVREASGTRHVPDRSGYASYDPSAGPVAAAATPVARAVRR